MRRYFREFLVWFGDDGPVKGLRTALAFIVFGYGIGAYFGFPFVVRQFLADYTSIPQFISVSCLSASMDELTAAHTARLEKLQNQLQLLTKSQVSPETLSWEYQALGLAADAIRKDISSERTSFDKIIKELELVCTKTVSS